MYIVAMIQCDVKDDALLTGLLDVKSLNGRRRAANPSVFSGFSPDFPEIFYLVLKANQFFL
jgi:hypothetical protein